MELKINEQVTSLNLTVVEGGESSFPGGDAVQETGATILAKLTINNVPFPLALLPDANLSATQFTKPGNDIEINLTWLDQAIANMGYTKGGGTGTVNTTPAAPTITADDTADTLLASHALGTSEIVMSINDAAYVAYSPISVGNVARAAGYWKFKVKSATGRNESAVVSSPAFTVASVGGLIQVTSWPLLEDAVATGNTVALNGIEINGQGRSNMKIAAGTSGYVQYTPNTPGSDTGFLVLDSSTSLRGGGSNLLIKHGNGNYFTVRVDGPYIELDGNPVTPHGPNSRGRIRVDTTTAYFEASTDSGTNWNLIYSTPRPSGDLYVKVFGELGQNVSVQNIEGVNLVIA